METTIYLQVQNLPSTPEFPEMIKPGISVKAHIVVLNRPLGLWAVALLQSYHFRIEDMLTEKPGHHHCHLIAVTNTYSPPQVERIWLWVYYNKIPIQPIFYLLKGAYIAKTIGRMDGIHEFQGSLEEGWILQGSIPTLPTEQVWMRLRHGCGFLWQSKMYWSHNYGC